MEPIIIHETAKTPGIDFNAENGKIEIKGRSIPEDPFSFYKPLLGWLERYATEPKSATVVNIQLEYFNTSSSKCILDVFKKIEDIHKAGSEVTINWYYEEDDEDIYETGQDYESMVNIPFKMIEI